MTTEPRASAEADVHYFATLAGARDARGTGSPVTVPRVSPTQTPAEPGGTAGQARAGDDDLSPSSPAARLCPITVHPPTHGVHGERVYGPRKCGEPVARGGLCEHHADERDRLAAP